MRDMREAGRARGYVSNRAEQEQRAEGATWEETGVETTENREASRALSWNLSR